MGTLINKIIFDDIDSSDYGVFISGEGAYNAPTRRGELVLIPRRNGALFLDEEAFDNIEVSYPAFIGEKNNTNFAEKMMELRSALTAKAGYTRLEDTYHPDEFRLGIYHAGLEVKPQHYNRAGEFTMIFDCKPQRFLKSGERSVVFNMPGTIFNPTPFESMPIVKVTGDGVIAFSSAQKTYSFTVTDNPSTITIDTELMESYIYGGELHNLTDQEDIMIVDAMLIPIQIANGLDELDPMNSHVSFTDYITPKIPSGEVNVGWDGTISKVEIIPRWWRL